MVRLNSKTPHIIVAKKRASRCLLVFGSLFLFTIYKRSAFSRVYVMLQFQRLVLLMVRE